MTEQDLSAFSAEMKKMFIAFHRSFEGKENIVKQEVFLYFETMKKAFTLHDVQRTVKYLLIHHTGFYPTIADFFNALKVIKKRDAQIKAGQASEQAVIEYKQSLLPCKPDELKGRIAVVDEVLKMIEGQMK